MRIEHVFALAIITAVLGVLAGQAAWAAEGNAPAVPPTTI